MKFGGDAVYFAAWGNSDPLSDSCSLQYELVKSYKVSEYMKHIVEKGLEGGSMTYQIEAQELFILVQDSLGSQSI